MSTVGGERYYGAPLETKTTATICQASFRPTIALPLSEIVVQNRIAEDCEWTWEHNGRTGVVGDVKDVVTFKGVDSERYHAITATRGDLPMKTATPSAERRL